MQAGLPPAMHPNLYETVASAIKSEVPNVHLHAFSPEEVIYGAKRSKRTVKEMLQALKDAGVDTLPGTSAEILDDDIRKQIAGQRLSTDQWINVIQTAHELGFKTTSTMMYGHVEEPVHIARHIDLIRKIQVVHGGFTEFVPLSFVSAEAPMYKNKTIPNMRSGPTGREVLLVHAVARLMLCGHIPNIQVSWVKEGQRMAQLLLQNGVNDLGGTLMNESISTAAGSQHGQLLKPTDLEVLVRDIDRIPYERSTTYEKIQRQDAVNLNVVDPQMFGSYKKLVEQKGWRAKEILKRQQRPHNVPSRSYSTHGKDNQRITYSQSHTIVPTFECFNVCSYCNFRKNIGMSPWLSLEEAGSIMRALRRDTTVDEILILSGEVHPKAKNRSAWLEHIVSLCKMALEHGFLPHSNVGPLTEKEMSRLAQFNPSMGLMLEQVVNVPVHKFAPSKNPQLRLEQLEMAGKLKIPFTTGLLLGIGESPEDRTAGLLAIAELAGKHGHIQEVILQPFSPGEHDKWQTKCRLSQYSVMNLPSLVEEARHILPDEVAIQVPPNLLITNSSQNELDISLLLRCLDAGATDLGGISPKDEVNPTYNFPDTDKLSELLAEYGYSLEPRLCVHTSYYHLLEQCDSRTQLHDLVMEHGLNSR